MQFIYPTTRAGFFDTKKIAKDKWLQQLQNPSTASAGLLDEPQNTNNNPDDSKLMTLQKILTALQ